MRILPFPKEMEKGKAEEGKSKAEGCKSKAGEGKSKAEGCKGKAEECKSKAGGNAKVRRKNAKVRQGVMQK